MDKKVYFFIIIIFSWGCSSNCMTEKRHNKSNNIINVNGRVKEIVIKDLLINNYSWLQIIDRYLFIKDYKSANEFIHIFNKNDFKYITSTAFKGQGPGEIANIGHIAEDKVNRKFYVSDHGKNKIFSYSIDSVIIDPAYLPVEKTKMGEQVFPTEYVYINDTLSIGMTIQRLGSGNFKPVVGKFNMKTGKITPMSYTIHPDVKKKRVCFDISMKHGIYVETYIPRDLMTICSLDGKLKYNVYGSEWTTEAKDFDYYGPVAFCKDKIVALYSGNRTFINGRTNYPTKFVIFDLEGNYLKTLETEYQIISFCYDEDNNRILMSMNDEMQFAYIDLENLLD